MERPPFPRFPHDEQWVNVGDARYSVEDVLRWLEPYVSAERRQRLDTVLAHRTYSLMPVADRVYDRGNLSAVMRTSESLGCQGFQVIRGEVSSRVQNRVAGGAQHWLDITRWDSGVECIRQLKERGYRICVTAVDPQARSITEVDFTAPVALVLGNERDGVSPEVQELADDRVFLPMVGLTESYNISVAGAVGLYHAFRERCARLGRMGDLSPAQARRLRAEYWVRSVNRVAAILERLSSDDVRSKQA
ncbi:MAG: RNA methyltransferase [Bdellovibrionales bacterium]|nr:RNA methyltransferase [Bdellovibrionales bacterium]